MNGNMKKMESLLFFKKSSWEFLKNLTGSLEFLKFAYRFQNRYFFPNPKSLAPIFILTLN